MMTLRTPRRRISPRTRKRYRAIRNFFKRAIGSPSQPDIEINSSIAVNVTDLNRKIVGLEQQLSEVSKTCREFIDLEGSRNESSTRRDSQSIATASDLKDDSQTQDVTESDSRRLDTKILYKTPETKYRHFEQSDSTPKHSKEINENQYKMKHNSVPDTQKKKNRSKMKTNTKINNTNQNLRSASDNIVSSYSTTSSFHSLAALKADHIRAYSGDYVDKRAQKKEARFHNHQKEASEQQDRHISKNYQLYEERAVRHLKPRTGKHGVHGMDQDFIADIIKRQYKPLKLFGRRESDVSQFSEPMCRDHEFNGNENIQESTELCSCCYRGRHSSKPNNNTRSACDTRLYDCVQIPRLRCRRGRANAYNDTELYDLIPVKEKSSPKTRNKFYQDNLASYHNYREVLPSPRTHRPRLNLKAQYSETEDQTDVPQSRKRKSPIRQQSRHDVPTESTDSDQLSIIQIPQTRKRKQERLLVTQEPAHQDMGTMSSLQYPEHFDIDDCTPKTQVTVSSDKTDKAICEIKDILQTFLQEIKKEASSSGKSEVSNKTDSNSNQQVNAGELLNNGYNFKMNSAAQCSDTAPAGPVGLAGPPSPFMPAFTNPCCYPIMPMYPMLQNSFAMPSPSYSCKCVSKNEDTPEDKNNTNNDDETFQNKTDELIKEIYKFVAQSPTFSKKKDIEPEPKSSSQNKVLTSRSVGGSQVQKQDVKVGTRIRCYSKSCEALRSGVTTTSQVYSTLTTYSDTVLENQSHEATMTSSETEFSSELLEIEKKKKNIIGNVLRSFGLFKKKKDTSEELSESTIETDIKNRRQHFRRDGSPYRQAVTNYMMHGREYYRNPPIPHDYAEHRYPLDYADHVGNYAENPDPLNYAEHAGPRHYTENPDPRHYVENPDRRHYAENHDPRNYAENPDRRDYSKTRHRRDHAERSEPRFYADHMNGRDYAERLDRRDYLEPPVRHDYLKPPVNRDYSGRYEQDYQPPYNPAVAYPPLPPVPDNDPYFDPRMHQRYDHPPTKSHSRRPSAPAAQYPPDFGRYGHVQSAANAQVPLCLKEIEVKSMATQSERKLSFFHKIKQKMHNPAEPTNNEPKALATQTKSRMWKPPPEKPSLWKTWQTKAMEGKEDNLAYSYMQQQRLAAGDTNMRNKMIKKMFYKRNPFSPKNLIVRTLLGKDKSSYGNPPAAAFRPRIFF